MYLLFFASFVLRLINLNQSLWLDEAIVAKVMKTIPFHLVPLQFSPADVHPPLYYMTMSLWTQLFGYSEIALRMPSILYSMVTGWFVYKIGVLLKGKILGLWAAAFFLLNPLIIYYSQEARMHMMAAMFLSIALYYFLQIVQTGRTKKKSILIEIILYNIFSALAMLTFYGSGFFIMGMIVVFCVISTKRSEWRGYSTLLMITKNIFTMSWGISFSLLILSPLLYQQLMNAKVGLSALPNWSAALGKTELKNVLMIFLKFATGRLSWYPKWNYYLVASVPTLFIWLIAVIGIKKNRLFGYLFIIPLFFALIVSFFAPMMMYFRFLYLIPVMSIMLAVSVIPTPFDKLRVNSMEGSHKLRFLDFARNDKIRIIIVALYIFFSLIYLFLPQFHREDWKRLAGQLRKNIPTYIILPSSDPVSYYRDDVSLFELRNIEKMNVPETIQVIPYTSGLYGVDYVKALQKKGCIKESQTYYRGDVTLEKWNCHSLVLRHPDKGAI